MDDMLKCWNAFTRFLVDGHICLSNNAAERAVRGVALEWKFWLFCGSDRAAVMYSLMVTALCRARHRAVYAARRTMPSRVVFPRFLAARRLVGSA
jgi:transposase